MIALLAALALARDVTPSPPPPPAAPSRVVVVVGHNGGAPDPRPPLSFADDDAARLFQALLPSAKRAFLLATFDRDSARAYPELTDVAREPSRENLARVLGEAFWILRQEKSAGRDTELVFAFAGHGDVSDAGEGFVVLSDGAFTRGELLTQVVEASPADINHVVIDACASYFMVQSRGSESAPVPLTAKLLDVIQPGASAAALARTGVLLSTSSAAEVHESNELSSGVFSFLLRSALTGASDGNRDGRVEYGEAAAFITQAASAQTDPRARLSIHARAPKQRPHAALLDLSRSGAEKFLAVDEGKAVHLRILDSRGVPYAELYSSGEPLLVALLGHPFFVVQQGDDEALLVARKAGAYALSSLTFEDSARPRARGGVEEGLFSAPHSAAYTDGYLAASDLPQPLAGAPFSVEWVQGAAQPLRVPVDVIGLATLGLAGVAGLGAGVAVVGNQISFAQLSSSYQQTGTLDAKQTLQVEGWRTAATALSVSALALGLLGGGAYLWSMNLEDGALEVR